MATLDRHGQVVGNDPICLQKHHQETSRSVGIDKTLGVERSAIGMPSRDWGRNRTTPRGTTTAQSCVHISPPLTVLRRRTSPPAGTTCRRDSLYRCLHWKARFPLPDPDGVNTVSLLAHRFLSSLALRQIFTRTHNERNNKDGIDDLGDLPGRSSSPEKNGSTDQNERSGAFVHICDRPAGSRLCRCRRSRGRLHGHHERQGGPARTAADDADLDRLWRSHGFGSPYWLGSPPRMPHGPWIVRVYAVHICSAVQRHAAATGGTHLNSIDIARPSSHNVFVC